MNKSLERKINFLMAYAIITTLIFSFFIFSAYKEKDKKLVLDELTVKRVDVVGEDGSLRMVISNKDRQHSGRMNGKDMPKRVRQAGMIFFNDEGDECGGLVYAGSTIDSKTKSGMSFTTDQYQNDQVIQILNAEGFENGKGTISRGIQINEYPDGATMAGFNKLQEDLKNAKDESTREQIKKQLSDKEYSKTRVFLGRNRQNNSGLFLSDNNGKLKMRIYVDKDGQPRWETLDEKGEVKNLLNEHK